MVLNAIGFLLCSLIAIMVTVLINFQQKFTFVKVFNIFAIQFLKQKGFLARLKSASKSSLIWLGKCHVFLLKLHLAIDPSTLASKNNVT